MELPNFVVLHSKHHDTSGIAYLSYNSWGHLQFIGQDIFSPSVKFEVIPAKTGHGCVHIRCCDNNKYWVFSPEQSMSIILGADEPEEDQSKPSCTLFEPFHVDGDKSSFAFRCAFKGLEIGYNMALGLTCSLRHLTTLDVPLCKFTIIDCDSLLLLPKRVIFWDNRAFAKVNWIKGKQCVIFNGVELSELGIQNEIITNKDGSICIKNHENGCFWRADGGMIRPDSTTQDSNTIFFPLKIGENTIALRHMASNMFCRRITTQGMHDVLSADAPTLTKDTFMLLREPVISRNIYNVIYKLSNSRTYNESITTMVTGHAHNDTNVAQIASVSLPFKKTSTTSWGHTVSVTEGIKIMFETGILQLVNGKVEVSLECTEQSNFEGVIESETEVETVYQVVVPPLSKVELSLIATKATIEVPFSYIKKDMFVNGDKETTLMHDGVFTTTDYYNFQYKSEQVPL